MRRFFWAILSIFVLVAFWQLQAWRIANDFILPRPLSVILSVKNMLLSIQTYTIIAHTFMRLIVSLALAGITGLILGLFAGESRSFDAFMQPLVTSLRTLPVASVIVIIMILFSRQNALYVITFLMLFPIVFESTKQGVLNIERSLKEALSLEEDRWFYQTFCINLPLAIPYVKTAFLQSIGLGFKVLVMAEFISQTNNSIGQSLYAASVTVNYERVFAWTLIIIVIVVLMEIGVRQLRTSS